MSRRAPIRAPRTFVIRVYRIRHRIIGGQLEDVDRGWVRPFSSADELWSLISGGRKTRTPNVR
jgi:hypothetical protein